MSPVEYHSVRFECHDDTHVAFLPALGVKISYRSHQTLVEGMYALYEKKYGPNDIVIVQPYDCPEAH